MKGSSILKQVFEPVASSFTFAHVFSCKLLDDAILCFFIVDASEEMFNSCIENSACIWLSVGGQPLSYILFSLLQTLPPENK